MSFGFTPLVVDLPAVAAVWGCGRLELIDAVMRDNVELAEAVDESRIEQEEDNDPAGVAAPMTLRAAVAETVSGRLTVSADSGDLGAEYVYAAALVAICRHLGDELPNSDWEIVQLDWFATVDAALVLAGVPADQFTTTDLWARRPSLPGWPRVYTADAGVGHVPRTTVGLVAGLLSDGPIDGMEPDVAGAVREVRSWLVAAAGRGRDLVGVLR